MKKIDKEIENLIIERYQSGIPMRFVGKDFGINGTTVFNILKRNKIKTRSKGGIEYLNEEEIVSLYKSGMSSSFIAEKYNVTTHTITNLLEKNGIQRNNIYHNLNLIEDYWENIDTKDKAYFLGFLITDGNVIGNAVRLSLHIRDKEILEIFSKVTRNENKLYEDNRDCVSFGVKRKKWVDDLSKYGVIPNKTLTVTMPLLQEDLMPHLLRGLIDGDGWITKNGKIGFCGNKETVTQVRNYLVNKLNVYNVSIIQCKSSTLYMIQWANKRDYQKICEYLYQDKEKYYLQRKYKNYLLTIHGNTEVSSEIAKGSETP